MSKCREEFMQKTGYAPKEAPINWLIWQSAWNARGNVDSEICLTERDSSGHEESFGYNSACLDCAEAIEKEDEK